MVCAHIINVSFEKELRVSTLFIDQVCQMFNKTLHTIFEEFLHKVKCYFVRSF